jgi:hypothetical protein
MDKAILDKYRGRWVAFDAEGAVMADAAEIDELFVVLDESAVVGTTIQRIPLEDEPLFIGLR